MKYKVLSKKPSILTCIAILLAIISCEPKHPNTGKVIKIKDGDSIVLLDSLNKEIEIRLAFIDAPERNQDFGSKSRTHLSNLIYGKQVKYEIIEPTDRYGRIIGEIILNDTFNVNKSMIENGMAWHYDQYPGGFFYEQLERKARREDRGLWSQPSPTPPWEYRRK